MLEILEKIALIFAKFITPELSILIICLIYRRSISKILITASDVISRLSYIKGVEFSHVAQEAINENQNIKKIDKKEIEKYLEFERIYRVIYGSQISLLDSLNTLCNSQEEFIKTYFLKAKKYYTESYKAINFEQWIGFLIKKELCLKNEDNYLLTENGREFLVYMVKNGMPKNKLL